MSATEILKNAAGHIADRAKERDTVEERSMRRAVDSFNALTGAELSETDGWLFMVCLKLARATAGGFKLDDYEDMAAYAALAGECEADAVKARRAGIFPDCFFNRGAPEEVGEQSNPEPLKLETVDDGNPMDWHEKRRAGLDALVVSGVER